MYSGQTYAANAVNCSDVYYSVNDVNLTNTIINFTGTAWSTVYLVGTLSGSTVTVDSTPFTTSIPIAADNKVYFPIGIMYNSINCYFYPTGKMFAYLNNRFSEVTAKDIKTISRIDETFTATRVDGETFTFDYEKGMTSQNLPPITIGTSWVGTTAPYTQTISVNGILETDVPIVDIYLANTNYADIEAQLIAYSYIYRITTTNNSITVYANEPTETAIQIQMKIV